MRICRMLNDISSVGQTSIQIDFDRFMLISWLSWPRIDHISTTDTSFCDCMNEQFSELVYSSVTIYCTAKAALYLQLQLTVIATNCPIDSALNTCLFFRWNLKDKAGGITWIWVDSSLSLESERLSSFSVLLFNKIRLNTFKHMFKMHVWTHNIRQFHRDETC